MSKRSQKAEQKKVSVRVQVLPAKAYTDHGQVRVQVLPAKAYTYHVSQVRVLTAKDR
jgi:hypothetical protein